MKYTPLFTAFCLFALSAHAALVTKPVAYENAGVKLEGYLVYDDAKVSATQPAPGVLVVHEWWGLNAYAKGKAEALAKLVSPIDITVLRRFALAKRLDPGQPLWEIMRMIGEDLLDYVKSLRTRLDFIARHAEIWTVDIGGQPAKILFLTRTDPLPDDPSMGIDRYIEISGLADEVVGTVSPDRRSTGYGLSRFRDSARLDFTRIADQPGVHFAHARGFVAKTSLTDLAQLKVLLALSGVAPARP